MHADASLSAHLLAFVDDREDRVVAVGHGFVNVRADRGG
jgi:hypothetical protein